MAITGSATRDKALVAAARRGDEDAFRSLIERYRRELLTHCYRLIGSLHDADDAVQEALLRAWKGLPRFRGDSSLRAWLYRIATNVCFDVLQRRPRRILPMSYRPSSDPSDALLDPVKEAIWLEPFPDDFLSGDSTDPAARFSQRESIGLAFLAAIQELSPRQRAALILRDVLGWEVSEVSALLETSVPAVNSGLQRARATLRKRFPAGEPDHQPHTDDAEQSLVEQYIRAWQEADIDTLVRLLREDVILAMPPIPSWYQGRDAVARFIASTPFFTNPDNRLRLRPTSANGLPALAAYAWDTPSATYHAYALMLLKIRQGKIAEITGWPDPSLFRLFGLPVLEDPSV